MSNFLSSFTHSVYVLVLQSQPKYNFFHRNTRQARRGLTEKIKLCNRGSIYLTIPQPRPHGKLSSGVIRGQNEKADDKNGENSKEKERQRER